MGLDAPNTMSFSRVLIVSKGDVSIESGNQNVIAIQNKYYYLKGLYAVSSVRVDVWNGVLFVNANENVKLILRSEEISYIDIDALGSVNVKGGKYPNIRFRAKGNASLDGDFKNIDATVGGDADLRGSGETVRMACGGRSNSFGSFQRVDTRGLTEGVFEEEEDLLDDENDEGSGESVSGGDEDCEQEEGLPDEDGEVEESEEDEGDEDDPDNEGSDEEGGEDDEEIVEKDFDNVSIDTSGDVHIKNGDENLIACNGEYYYLQGCFSLSTLDIEVSDGSLTIDGSEDVTLILQTERLEQLNIDSSGNVTLNDGQYKNVEIDASGDVDIVDGKYDDLNIDASGDVKINGTFGDVNIDASGDVTVDGTGASLHVDAVGECVNNGTFAYLFGCN